MTNPRDYAKTTHSAVLANKRQPGHALLTKASLLLLTAMLAGCGAGGGTESNNQTGEPNNNSNNQSPNPDPNPNPTEPPPETTTRWSDPSSWDNNAVPEAGQNVLIPAGTSMLLDVHTAALGTLAIEGDLVFEDETDVSIRATDMEIRDGGLLQIGSSSEPFEHRATITLTGARGVHLSRPEDNGLDNDGVSRGLRVRDGGSLVLVGATPSLTKTKLNAHAQAGATNFTLADPVSWRAGDQIAISTTDFWMVGETEVLTLASDTAGAASMSTVEALDTFRWGRLQFPIDQPVNGSAISLSQGAFTPASPETFTVLDERAEVVNLSRNIVIQGADDADWNNSGFGVHVMVMGLASTAQLEGVEFRRCGQRQAMGRYPFHWHMLSYAGNGDYRGDAPSGAHYVRRSSIHGSSNRAVTIHGTCGVVVHDTYAVGIEGHAFFFEDGPERRNEVTQCVAMKVRRPAEPIKQHDGSPSGFWNVNPDNTIQFNSASDSEGVGFDNSFAHECFGLSRNVDMNPNDLGLGVFDDNVGHGCRLFGIRTSKPVVDEQGDTTVQYYQHNAGPAVFRRNVVWKNSQGGYRNRVRNPIYDGWLSADNSGADFSGATRGDSLLVNSMFIGSSLNNATPPDDLRRRAFASYHFFLDAQDITAINFPWTNSAITANSQFVIGGGVMDTSDLYLHPISVQSARSTGWRLINSCAGFRTPPPYFDQFPVAHPNGNRHWAISGALHDPYGYWGPAGNYLVPDEPFYRYGMTSFQMASPGHDNGLTTPDRFYGLGHITPGVDSTPSGGSTDDPIRLERLDANNAFVDEHYIGESATTSIFDFKHFGVKHAGRYRMVLPSTNPPDDYFNICIDNGWRADDWFLLALPWDGNTPVTGRLDHGTGGGSLANRVQAGTARELNTNGNSVNDVLADPTGATMWQDTANNLVWFKHVGGLTLNVPNFDGVNNESLWRRYQLRLSAQ